MRVTSYNVENLFSRAKVFNQDTAAQGRPVLNAYTRTSNLFQKSSYSDADKSAILKGLTVLGIDKTDDAPMVLLRQNRGHLLKRSRTGRVEIVASGRGDWIGWLELKKEAVSETATRNTGQVIRDLDPDVLAVVEAEDRTSLLRFNADVLGQLDDGVLAHVMVIDGNDNRGIDVGILSRSGYSIPRIASHVDDVDDSGVIFNRDCAEYWVDTPSGSQLLVMVNHFKSKGYGSQAESNNRRLRQAERVRAIYQERRTQGAEHVVIVGDFNDFPMSAALDPLLGPGTDLRDVSAVPGFQDGGFPGTYTTGSANKKIDYILCSPAVFASVTAAGIFRAGVWTASGRWPMYPNMKRPQDAASDHAAIWADLNL
jgi:endonuclease/exonuclease/phosphatase family metal-dependent hydrolase